MAQYDYDFLPSARALAVSAGAACPHHSARRSQLPKNVLSAARASTSAASQRNFWFTPLITWTILEMLRVSAGRVGQQSLDWAKLIANKNNEIHRLNGVYRKLLDDCGRRNNRRPRAKFWIRTP